LRKKINSSERILMAALKLFVKKGYKGSGVAEITKLAGFTRGALYCHFKTKEQLTIEIIKLFEEKFLQGMIKYVNEGTATPSEKIEKTLHYTIRFAGEYKDLCLFMTMISAEMCGSRNRLEKHLKSVYQQWSEFLTEILREGKQVGEFKETIDPYMLSLIIIGVHDGVLLQKEMNQNNIDIKSYTNQFRNLVVSGVIKQS